MTVAEELALRRAQLKASENKHGMKERCEALRARIAELEAANG